LQSKRIDIADGISADIGHSIDTTGQPDRIRLRIAAKRRIVVAVAVVPEARFLIEGLTVEADVQASLAPPVLLGACEVAKSSLLRVKLDGNTQSKSLNSLQCEIVQFKSS
jgi:hypothetical protein